MGEWGALEWVVALVLLGLVVGIVWFMTRGGAVQDRLSGRGQDHPEIDEGDGYLPDEEGSRYDAGGQDAAEVAGEGDGPARPGHGLWSPVFDRRHLTRRRVNGF